MAMKAREVETAGNARNNNAYASNAPKTQQRAQPQQKQQPQQSSEDELKRQYLQDPDGQAEIIAGLQVLKKVVDAYDMTSGAVAARNQGKSLVQLGFDFIKQQAAEIKSYFDPTASGTAAQNAIAPSVANAVRNLGLNNPKERVFLKQNSEKLKTIRELFTKEQLKPFAQRAGFSAGTEEHYLDFLYSNQWDNMVSALIKDDSVLDKVTRDAQKIDTSNAAKAMQWEDGTPFVASSVRDTDTLRTLGKSGKELGKMMANVGDTVTDIGYKIRSLVGEDNHQPIEGINPEWHINRNGVKERYNPATTNELSNLRRIYDQCQNSYKTLIALANKVETNSKEEYDIIKGYVDANPKYESPQNIEQLKNVLLTHPAGLTSSYAQPQQ